jgi:hypothetical protein
MDQRTCTIGDCEKPLVAKGLCRTHYQRQWKTGSTSARSEPTELERFWTQVEKQPNGCWHWTGHIKSGYGQFRFRGKHTRPHRAAYELFVGPIPEGMQVDHDCHNRDETCNDGPDCMHRRCVNPEHLHLKTGHQNIMAGRTPAAKNAAKTQCGNGHAFDEVNTYISPTSGSRVCRTCQTESNARSYAKRMEARTKVRKDVSSE